MVHGELGYSEKFSHLPSRRRTVANLLRDFRCQFCISSTSSVFSGRDWFKVGRTDTACDATEMVGVKSCGNRSDLLLVHRPMRIDLSPLEANEAIAVVSLLAFEDETRRSESSIYNRVVGFLNARSQASVAMARRVDRWLAASTGAKFHDPEVYLTATP